MRALNVCAALSGLLALGMLAFSSHLLRQHPEAVERIKFGGFIQLGAAAASLALANRRSTLNVIAGALVLGGAAIFSGALYALSLTGVMTLAAAAPVGGLAMLAGWAVLVFAKPGT